MAKKNSVTAEVEKFEPNLNRATELVTKLMAIPGKSCEEELAAEYVREHLEAVGIDPKWILIDNAHTKTDQPGNVGNLILKLPGTLKGPRRMFTAHMDTVPLCIGSQPKREGDFIRSANPHTGLGADDRSGVAVLLNTALEIIERRLPHPPLTFCWLVQEEIGPSGSRHVQQSLLGKPSMCFNFDGSLASKVTVGATSGYRMSIAVRGIASHAGVAPELGVSAISIAALAIADLQRNGWLGLVLKGKHRGTSNIGVIRGGEATNVITDLVLLQAEARSHVPSVRERIVREIQKAFRNAVKELKNGRNQRGSVAFEGQLDYEAFKLEVSTPVVQLAIAEVEGLDLEPEIAISNGGLDANWLNAHGIPTVSLGAGQMSVHTVDEALCIPEFHTACRIALRLATAV